MTAKAPYHRVDGARSIGFPQSGATLEVPSQKLTAAQHPTSATPVSPKKQPKGRWFVSGVLVSVLGFIALSLWNEFGRYRAYGEIEGTVIRLSPSASGRISSIAVTEGDYVRAGQVPAAPSDRGRRWFYR